MSRARHRLTGRREATHNAPTSSDFTMIAYLENDTYVRHVAGPIDGGLTGGNAVTGSTSDSFIAAVTINGIDGQTAYPISQVGSNCHTVGSIHTASQVPASYYHEWPYYYNWSDYSSGTELSPPTVDGWLGSFAKRYYAYCDLNNFSTSDGLNLQNGDAVNSAILVLNLAAQGALGAEAQYQEAGEAAPGGQYPHDRRSTGDGGGLGGMPYYDNNIARDYNAYKVLHPYNGASMDHITWWGWTGGANDDISETYWVEAGGSSYGVDIDELGTSAGVCVPDTDWNGCGFVYPPTSDRQNSDPNAGPEVPFHPSEVRIDITHLVDDAISNESGILRLAIYGQNDTDLTSKKHTFDDSNQSPAAAWLHPWEFENAKQTLVFYSASNPTQVLRPRIEIDFTRR